MSCSTFRIPRYHWLFVVLLLVLLIIENIPGDAAAYLSSTNPQPNSAEDLASLPIMYD